MPCNSGGQTNDNAIVLSRGTTDSVSIAVCQPYHSLVSEEDYGSVGYHSEEVGTHPSIQTLGTLLTPDGQQCLEE